MPGKRRGRRFLLIFPNKQASYVSAGLAHYYTVIIITVILCVRCFAVLI